MLVGNVAVGYDCLTSLSSTNYVVSRSATFIAEEVPDLSPTSPMSPTHLWMHREGPKAELCLPDADIDVNHLRQALNSVSHQLDSTRTYS